ncbi:MAG: glycosyltransferase, partial [Rhodobacteraceae bacterium]|nr:glycosyltransferase [Paracoccaceae bacterium]
MNLALDGRIRHAPAWPVAPATRSPGALIGQLLVARGALDPGDLVKALALKGRQEARLGEILLTHGMVSEAELYGALAEQWKAQVVDLIAEAPDPRLIDAAGADFCVRHRIVPWRRVGGGTVIATARPEEFARRLEELPDTLKPAMIAVAPERDVLDALVAARSRRLVAQAETCAPAEQSCRAWDGRRFSRLLLGAVAATAGGLALAPAATFAALTVLASVVLAVNMGLRAAALRQGLRRRAEDMVAPGQRKPPPAIARLPVVSILVPLFHERAIAERLVARLARLSYPRELLDICLVTEDNDETTRATLAATRLPRWLRVVTVPEGTLRTKPRALNYALDFARGSIIGVYDAEDAPDPDQIHRLDGALLHHRIRQLVPGDPAGDRAAGLRHPAGRHHAVLPPGGAGEDRPLGCAQRDRGCRPRHPPGAARVPRGTGGYRDARRGELPPLALGQAAVALDQGLRDDLGRPHARPGAALARPRRVALSGRAGAVRRLAAVGDAGAGPVVVLAAGARSAAS